MNSLLPIILIAVFGLIKSRMDQSRDSEGEKKGEKPSGVGLSVEMQHAVKQLQGLKEKSDKRESREPDYKDLPIEVQRAIKRFQEPKKKSAKKEARGQATEQLNRKRQMKDEALKQATEAALIADRAKEEAPVASVTQEPEAAKPSPFAAIDRFDEAYRPFIYNEVFNKPKCKRK